MTLNEAAAIRAEQKAMERFATKRHAEHSERDDFCRKCRREALHEWARREGLIR